MSYLQFAKIVFLTTALVLGSYQCGNWGGGNSGQGGGTGSAGSGTGGTTGQGGNQGSGGGDQSGNQGNNQGINVNGINNQNAPVPQYWVADAAIFTGNAARTAEVMQKEGKLNVQASNIIANQAQYLAQTTNRALQDLNALLTNAQQTNPNAVPAIRRAIAELVAAMAQANVVVNTAKNEKLGPNYTVAIQSTKYPFGTVALDCALFVFNYQEICNMLMTQNPL